MKVNNVGLNQTQKVANPFKTSRNSTTNPFKYSNFEGNTLQFADVFEGFENKKTPAFKAKMISSAVAGTMTKLRNLLPESIVNFVNRVREGVSNAWAYAKNTNIKDVAGIKQISEVLSTDVTDIGKGVSRRLSDAGSRIAGKFSYLNKDITEVGKDLSDSVSGMGKSLSHKLEFLNTDVTEIGKGLTDRWNSLISNIHVKNNKISKDSSVEELRAMWLEINSSESEAA